MLELRPNYEHCNRLLPPESAEAWICSVECTYCGDCVENVLRNVCPNCGAGFMPRPVRPSKNLKGDNYLGKYPASTKVNTGLWMPRRTRSVRRRSGKFHPRSVSEENTMQTVKDAGPLYDVERRAEHAARPGFRITELQISRKQKVPWHYHNNIQDTFYVLQGSLRIFMQDPKEEIRLGVGETYSVKSRRPHLVTNGGEDSATFFVLQGVGEYDFVPLLEKNAG